MVAFRILAWLVCCMTCFSSMSTAFAQPTTLAIRQVLQQVQTNLPHLEAYRQKANAAKQNIEAAKNSKVPDLTVGYQVNLATFNNITGMSYPGFLLPISGPPSLNNDLNFIPGSAVGALVKWNPYTFGQRNAAIDKASAEFKQANAAYNEQLFLYQYNAINIYLELEYLRLVSRNLQAAVDRNQTSLEQSLVLAKTGLRAGIDTSQFQSAIAQVEINLIRNEQSYKEKLVELTRLTGMKMQTDDIVLTDSIFSHPLILLIDSATSIAQHPSYLNSEGQRNIAAAALKQINLSWRPQLDIWGNAYSRGSGVNAKGEINKSQGFNLTRNNVGLGLQLSFAVLDFNKVKTSKKKYESLLKAEDANLEQLQLDICKQIETALISYKESTRISTQTPLLLKSAKDVYDGLKISYENGLINYDRLSQAQYELLQAEISQANAALQQWRSLLAVAVAKGNLNLFTDQLK